MGTIRKSIPDLLKQVGAIKEVQKTQQAEQASSFKKVDEKLPMSKIRRRALDNQSKLNNEQTLLGG